MSKFFCALQGLKPMLILGLLILFIFGCGLDNSTSMICIAADTLQTTDNKGTTEPAPFFETEIAVGILDFTAGNYHSSGYIEPLGDTDQYDKEIYLDGRVAFYLKGKIKGKYLLTAQLDTGEASLDHLFDDLERPDRRQIFEQIDPDKYYPVYGDQSTVYRDIESQGKFYVRLNWEASQALWGNYQVHLNDTELAQYHRDLYGLKFDFLKSAPGKDGSRDGTKLFWAEAATLHSRDVIKATGGSLYYLKHAEIVIGSEQLTVEVRDALSGSVIRTTPLEEGRDYQFDYLQGRVLLTRTLEQVLNSGIISSNYPLDGNKLYLVADYEFSGSSELLENTSYGIRTSQHLGDKLQLGTSYINEILESEEDYRLYGVDYRLKLNDYVTFTGEWVRTERSPANRFYSEDGGLTYTEVAETEGPDSSNAWEVGFNLTLPKDDGGFSDFNLNSFYRILEKGFSTSGRQVLGDTTEAGLELSGKLWQNYDLTIRYDSDTETTGQKSDNILLQLSRLYQRLKLTEEVRLEELSDEDHDYRDTLGAVRLDYRINEAVNIYGSQQLTLARNNETPKNNRTTVGADLAVNAKTNLNLEGSQGDLGNSAVLGLEYSLAENHQVYSTIQYDSDRFNGHTLLNTVGNKGKLSETVSVYTEHQIASGTYEDSVSDLYGVEYAPQPGRVWTFEYARSDVEKKAVRPVDDYRDWGIDDPDWDGKGSVDRNIFSIGLARQTEKLQYRSRLQLRCDDGEEDLTQVVTANSWEKRINNEYSLKFKLNYSLTRNETNNDDDARFGEASLGFAYRPINNDKINIIGELVYLDDLAPADQIDGTLPAERSWIAALDLIYQLGEHWELGEKVAYKKMAVQTDEESDTWEDNQLYLWVNRLTYTLPWKWDIYGEYRMLWNELAEDQKCGFLLAAYYNITKNIKLGIGYNFTDFSDDLTNLDYKVDGWFVNFIKKM